MSTNSRPRLSRQHGSLSHREPPTTSAPNPPALSLPTDCQTDRTGILVPSLSPPGLLLFQLPRCLEWVASGVKECIDAAAWWRCGLSGLWESGNPDVGFPLFHSPRSSLPRFSGPVDRNRRSCGNVGISPPLRDFQGAVGRVGNLSLVFHAIHSSVISTALRRSAPQSALHPGAAFAPCRNPLF